MALTDYLATQGSPKLPEIAGKYKGKRLIVCADSWRVWKDLEDAGCRSDVGRGKVRAPDGGDFMVVNKVGETFPGDIEHWYSNEGDLLGKFIAGRRSEYRREFEGPRHTHSVNKGARWHWPFHGGGTSGLQALVVGLCLGYDEVLACGMPLDNGPHNGEPHWRKCNFRREVPDQLDGNIHRYWKQAIELAFEGRVRSMSGRTREWLGAPR